MSGNTFGKIFTITTAGESHGGRVAVIIDGCPPGLAISNEDIQLQLDRRKPGQSSITTPRRESDIIQIQSGVFNGVTTGTPILLSAENLDAKSDDYLHLKDVFRPSHADYTYIAKYGIRDYRGSGRASARETLSRVAAGAIALKYLKQHHSIEVLSYVSQVGDIRCDLASNQIIAEMIESSIVRCPDINKAEAMIKLIEQVRNLGDSIGGIITTIIKNVPAGLGEPVFDKLHADLGKAILSINACRGFSIGEGFNAANMRGSEHNDALTVTDNKIRTITNHAGGIVGGISNGEEIILQSAFKPVSTINMKQATVNTKLDNITLQAHGRHDPCVLPRAVPVVDAMSALVLMDHLLRAKTINHLL